LIERFFEWTGEGLGFLERFAFLAEVLTRLIAENLVRLRMKRGEGGVPSG
jgi:hypothetical protein